jgi:Dihaem cytochrome c
MSIPRTRSAIRPLGAALTASGVVLALGLLYGPRAAAEGNGGSFGTVTDKVVQTECGACHMAFPAGMLPARSWQALMGKLDDHFGENAALDKTAAKHITEYLVANAADAGGRQTRSLRGVNPGETPLRITEMPWWIRAHSGEVSPAAFKSPRVKSKANCVACHSGAAKGFFGDD